MKLPMVPLVHLDDLWFQVAGTLCNLTCHHCFISCSPHNHNFGFLDLATVRRHLDESVAFGVKEYYFTGGEPFLNRDMVPILELALQYGPATVLTNGMLLKRQRLESLRALSHLPITLQVSLDGHVAEIHDAYRGAGSWASTVAAIRSLRACGFRVAIGATETPVNSPYTEELRAFVRELGIPTQSFFLRPLTKRGFSHEGIELRAEDVAPELTVTAEGVFWHPQSAGEAMLLSRDVFPLRDAVQLMQTNLEVMAAGGPAPQQYRCA